MGLMENDVMATGAAVLMIRPRLLVEAARHGARLRLTRGARPLLPPEVARAAEAERTHEALRRTQSPLYRPARHVEALSILFTERSRMAAPAIAPAQTKASGSAAFLRAI